MVPPLASARGQILILTALMMTTLLGIAALSIDASFMYDRRNTLAASADAAAKSVAMEIHRNPGIGPAAMRTFAESQVVAHGLTPAGCGSATNAGICINRPPMSGPFAGAGFPDYVEVTVAQVTPTFFGAVLGWMSATPGARAVAGTSSGPNCLVSFNGVSIGNAVISLPLCSVSIGGALCGSCGGAGHTEIDAQSISAGSWDGAGTMVPAPVTPAPSPSDPLAGLVPPVIPGSCLPGAGASLVPGCYSTIDASGMTLAPGLYIITGSLSMANNTTFTGAGVTLYFGPTATVSFGQHDVVTLSAPMSGTWDGIAWFFDRANANPILVNNNTTVDVTGAFYAMASAVDLGNHLGSAGDCSLIVVGSLSMSNGFGQLSNTCAGYGGSPLLSVSIAE